MPERLNGDPSIMEICSGSETDFDFHDFHVPQLVRFWLSVKV